LKYEERSVVWKIGRAGFGFLLCLKQGCEKPMVFLLKKETLLFWFKTGFCKV
jgi:hypothetical protein